MVYKVKCFIQDYFIALIALIVVLLAIIYSLRLKSIDNIVYREGNPLNSRFKGVGYYDIVNRNTIECNLTFYARLYQTLKEEQGFNILNDRSTLNSYDVTFNSPDGYLYRLFYEKDSKICTVISNDYANPLSVLRVME